MALVLIVVATYLAFTQVAAVAAAVRVQGGLPDRRTTCGSTRPVRIAGVNVGKVTKVERAEDSDLVEVTMEMDDEGLPIHKDATAKIRSRIFLEGNFFVDLQPGHARARRRSTTATRIPVTQTVDAGAARPAADRAPDRRPRERCRTC